MKLILSILFIIITIISFFTVIDPLYTQVKQLRADLSTYNIALDNSTELQKTRDSLLEIYKNIRKEDKDRLAHLLPTSINNIELILEIEKIANLHGMPIGNIKFDASNLKGKETDTGDGTIVVAENDPGAYLPYGVFPMEFSIEGKYETFLKFLEDLENNLRLVDIRAISFDVPIAANSKTNSSGPVVQSNAVISDIYEYVLKVDTYWLK